MLIVTGGAGFIGSNLVKGLNDRGRSDVMVVDWLEDGRKLLNLVDCDVFDLVDKNVFRDWLVSERELGEPIEGVFHLGALSDTQNWDGRLLLRENYEYSKLLLSYCSARGIPLIYASSASVYGSGSVFREEARYERPLNPYAYSKFLFDQLVRRLGDRVSSQVAGLRYFNVYGPREAHKAGAGVSIAYQLYQQLQQGERVRLFEGGDGCENGEQRRDFVWVGDCVDVNLWLLDHPEVSGIFNVGSGEARSFNEVARAVIRVCGRGEVSYIPFPEDLRGHYQSFTEADVGALREAGYDAAFVPVEEGVRRYVAWLEKEQEPRRPEG